MANISITRRCRRHCSYCFAKHELARNRTVDMPPETYDAALRFLQRSAFPEARLLGGEPTEHPRFSEYVDLALERGFLVVVFSGGIVPQPALAHMASLPAGGFMVVLNTVDPAGDGEPLANRHREICRTLGRKVMLGVNIRSSHDDPIYLFDWVTKYDLRRTIRVGITHPIWGGTNDFFKLGGPRIISVLERLVAIGAEIGVTVSFDCGFTPCMFSREFVDAHPDLFAQTSNGPDGPGACDGEYDASGARTKDPAGCAVQTSKSPAIPVEATGMGCRTALDILPEGDCIACYALSRFRRFPLPSAGGYTDLVSSFDRELSPVLPAGIHHECLLCDYREKKLCDGGCRARRALRQHPNALTSPGLEPEDEVPHK